MDIIIRNFFRLVRAGAFGLQEQLEPMSAYKWRKVMMLSDMHHITTETYAGLEVLSDQYEVQTIPEELHDAWAESASCLPEAERYNLDANLIKTLENALLNENEWIKKLVELGVAIRDNQLDEYQAQQLNEEITKHKLQKIVKLEGALLVKLMGLKPEELPFGYKGEDIDVSPFMASVAKQQEQLHFSQGNNIFVHTSNKSAFVRNAYRTSRFLKYSPKESLSVFFRSFAKSLNNIEE